MDAHARYSVKSAHGKFGLHCVKAACLIWILFVAFRLC